MAVRMRNIKDVYTEISEEAASIGNANANALGILPFGVRGVFAPAQRKLGLVVNEYVTEIELLKQLREVGQQAIKQALVERPDLTVGLIVGSAKNGHNFFDRKGK